MEISGFVYASLEKIKVYFNGNIDIKLISSEMYRNTPTEYCPLGELGVDVQINGKTKFLPCHICESVTEPAGILIIEQLVFEYYK